MGKIVVLAEIIQTAASLRKQIRNFRKVFDRQN